MRSPARPAGSVIQCAVCSREPSKRSLGCLWPRQRKNAAGSIGSPRPALMPGVGLRRARQPSGGLSRDKDLRANRAAVTTDIENRLAMLETLSTGDLQIEWQRLYRASPPIRLSRDLLLRGIAHRVQERVLGGLSLSAQRRLRA